MTHARSRDLLSDLLDGGLSPRDEARVQGHVEQCPRCERALEELRRSAALLLRLPKGLVPERWTPAAEARLRALAFPRREPRLAPEDALALRAVYATAAVVMAMLMVSLGPLRPERSDVRGHPGILAAAEREATLLAASFEPANRWAHN